jgi:uncharacterized membrane protein
MARFQESVEVEAPVSACYQRWLNFEEFPRFMEHVESVTRQGDKRWHWVVSGPLGKDLEWDAEVDGTKPNQLISWHSISDPDVGIQGAVVFEELGPNRTRIISTLQYEPPAGPLGALVAQVFSNPQQMVRNDLNNFKNIMEKATPTSQRQGQY